MVTNRTLIKIAAYGGLFTSTVSTFMYLKIQSGLKNSEYVKESMKILRKHPGAIILLGEPMKQGYLNLNTNDNFCDGYSAQFEVPIKGPKDKGSLFLWAKRQKPEEKWNLYRLELELKSDTSKRIILRNEQPPSS